MAVAEGLTYREWRNQGGAESHQSVTERLDRFWKDEVLSLRKTDGVVVLIVSHGGIMSTLLERVARKPFHHEMRNCSITEIEMPVEGPGCFLALGNWDHLQHGMITERERLENSTGE